MASRQTLLCAALLGMMAVMLGAFGAHALSNVLELRMQQVYQTAVQYQFWHALALLATGILQRVCDVSLLKVAALLFLAGVLLFCGSLYLMALTGIRQLGMITPLGGILFILGWAFLAWSVIRLEKQQDR
ncbi:DUF423 domain-containing protein [Nitrincola sp. MINF-07-Sa-05]|uniref:DUF423 domain-containing protein n=1 Tax=Nitrincola salilacus TaxID=3400273 RepID=UPI003917FE2B